MSDDADVGIRVRLDSGLDLASAAYGKSPSFKLCSKHRVYNISHYKHVSNLREVFPRSVLER